MSDDAAEAAAGSFRSTPARVGLAAPAAVRSLLGPAGLRVAWLEQPCARQVAVTAAVGAGPAHELPETSGVSHLVEHALLAGSERYPTRRAWLEAVAATGGRLEARTFKEHTELSFVGPASALEPGMALLAEALLRPRFEPAAVDTERRIVLEELATVGGDPTADSVARALWGERGLGLPILGSPASLASLTAAALADHHRLHYHAVNMQLGAAGPIDEAVLRRGLELLRGLSAGPPPTAPARLPVQRAALPCVHWHGGRSPIAQASLLFRVAGATGAGLLSSAPEVLAELFHQRLEERVIGAELPVYAVAAGCDRFVEEGFLYASFSVSSRWLEPLLESLLRELATLREELVSPAELAAAAQRSELRLVSQLDDPVAAARLLARRGLLAGPGEPLPLEAQVEALGALTPDGLRQAARATIAADGFGALGRGGPGLLGRRRLRRGLRDWLVRLERLGGR